MAIKKHGLMTYKREKNKVEISGDPADVKAAMWVDLIATHLWWIVMLIILLILVPKASIIPPVLQWLKKQLWVWTPFMSVAGYLQTLFSG